MPTFEIEAEYLHLYVGRRATFAGLTFTILAVRYEPERGRVLVEIEHPWFAQLEAEFAANQVLEVEHAAA